jgi:glutathione-regulated potassium-efflux system ancillary protein KefG
VRDIDGVTFHDLYEAYPDFHIQVAREQKLLVQHEVVVFHHPIFWFSSPAILKEWQDLVLVHGWAYGKEGTALKGKKLLSVISTGGRESLYSREGYHGHTIGEFLKPIERTAYVCKMEYLPPFVVYGTHLMTEEKIRRHGEDYRTIIMGLRNGRVDFEVARKFPRLNSDIKSIITE